MFSQSDPLRSLPEAAVESPPAQLEAFGFPPSVARVRLIARPGSWRATRALLSLFIGWGLLPLVALVPPHLPWAGAAFVGGGYFAWRFARERVTLLGFEGACPRCGADVHSGKHRPLQQPHPVHCPGCGQGLLLEVGSS